MPDSDRVERTREVMLGVEVENERRKRDIRGKGEEEMVDVREKKERRGQRVWGDGSSSIFR